jgi:hypothetical protein
VIQLCGTLSFVAESALQVRVVTHERYDLDRNGSVKLLIVGPKNRTHASATNQFLEQEVV